MDLFGKKALSSLQARCDKAQREKEAAAASLEEKQRKLESQNKARIEAEEEVENLRTRLTGLEQERDRVKESQSRSEQMVRWLEEREAGRDEAVKQAQGACETAERKAADLASEVDRLRSERDEALRRPVPAPAPAPTPAPVREPEPSPEALPGQRDENERLRRDLAEKTERLRAALRKAEHNRRAYLVTQMQLDLAEDRIYLLTKGKPRPVHGQAERADVDPDEKVVAEDVEGYEESEPAGG